MVDNFEQIKKLITFDSEDEFYYLQLLQRKKDNPGIGRNSRVIKNYYITSVEYLEKIRNEVIELCTVFNARASIRLNKRSFKRVAFKALQNMANTMANDDYYHMRSQYDKACGQCHHDKHKTWIIDIDNAEGVSESFKMFLYGLRPLGDKVVAEIPSATGVHLITAPFDLKEFRDHGIKDDVHKDNPTNLYIK